MTYDSNPILDAVAAERERIFQALPQIYLGFDGVNQQHFCVTTRFMQKVLKSLIDDNIGLDATTPAEAVLKVRYGALSRFDRDLEGEMRSLSLGGLSDLVDSIRSMLVQTNGRET
ncbi:MAG TPA: hypothetical protein VM689_15665 [Aliidongia sp.]|nr:hypothetical protein [Aliidongia sp.]